MKFIILILGLSICLTSTLTSAKHHHHYPDSPFPIPVEIDGYTGYTLDQARHIPSILDPFVSNSISCVVHAVKDKKFPAESYSFFMRHAFRKSVEGGYETLYYYRAFNPKNKEGNVYFGTFTIFYPTEAGYTEKFLSYTVDATVERSSI